MKLFALLLFFSALAFAQANEQSPSSDTLDALLLKLASNPCNITQPCSSANNIAWDMEGTPCVAPVWGNCASYEYPIVFEDVPSGMRVHILRLYGDHIAWPHGTIVPNTHAGILWAAASNAPHIGSSLKIYGAPVGSSSVFVWHQGAISSGDYTRYFSEDVSAGGLLASDNTMTVHIAMFESELGVSVHQELTFTMVYYFQSD